MDHQIQLRMKDEQWMTRMDKQRAEYQEREKRLEERLTAQQGEYQTRESALHAHCRDSERRMDGHLATLSEQSTERERCIKEYHATILEAHREKERNLERELEWWRERERRLEGQTKDMRNSVSGHNAAPSLIDERRPIRVHIGLDAASEAVVHSSAPAHNGVDHAMNPSPPHFNQKSQSNSGFWPQP
jgi:chromosome segregation ATPase